jgi:large subunit ribosomal protein L9
MGKKIEVLLRDHVPGLGRCGDVVSVAAGHARNYLMPKRIAVQANEENKKVMARRAERLATEEAAHLASVEATVASLSALVLSTAEKADDEGHLYGSVNAARVAELCTAAGIATEEKQVRLEHPIKAVGEHVVSVHVHGDLTADVKLEVTAAA